MSSPLLPTLRAQVRGYSTARPPSSSAGAGSKPAPLTRFVPTRPARNSIDDIKYRPRSPPSSSPNGGPTGGGGGGGRTGRKGEAQRWSNLTLILLASAVGSSTYMIGMSQGYKAGKRAAIDFPDPPSPPSSPSPSSSPTLPTVPLAPTSTSLVSSLLVPFSKIHCDSAPPPPPTSSPSTTTTAKGTTTTTTTTTDGCRLSEMVQYHCRKRPNRIVCTPLDRVFRMCPGRPAVEVTHLVEFDQNGTPFLPDEFAEAMPPSQHWHELRASDL
ncbi:uncharacterized protein PFL1_06915 [Pseudozyma flocculosa PF-1]|uniref:Uncharacterized protein n=1 Tax=Pseudozyma flocculosa PF-1 TaxID=1277687 RepID=A0A061H117_9BASI|nr:uncharacterized protein PFL1_06915 [Pseudozyma flocculosa PF-1]EPQ26167.1 hypothetical protein PFL1_06915 [Pseudozyma flocculosa PF-1]